jgi:adenosyl cobinamide kinase/adenosyl cobinamide phosphate guanylyltransferase
MSREMGSWVVPAERANSIFADPWNLIQVMLAKEAERGKFSVSSTRPECGLSEEPD